MAKTEPDGELESLLEYLKDARAFDFTGYKRASLSRRIQRRMQVVGVDNYAAYMSLLEANPGEFAELFNTILINVTSFLRDPEAWAYLESDVLPRIADRGHEDPIRVWSAGTATGQEAYSLAVLLAELVGEDRFRNTVKIYATDADETALVEARHARYPTAAVASAFGDERMARFWENEGTTSVFRQDLRRSLIFGRHDLVQHPPISRIDLLVCRNTLMYFTAEMQRRVLDNFHFAVAENGFLFLGKSEAMASRADLFEIVNLKQRIFRRNGRSAAPLSPVPGLRTPKRGAIHADDPAAVLAAAFEESAVAQMLVDPEGLVTAVNRHARALFGLGADAAGRPLKDLQISYRPIELRSLVDEAVTHRRPIVVHDVEWTAPTGEVEYFDVALQPLGADNNGGVAVTCTQVGRYKLLRDELERSQRELESAYEELQSTVEELETTNEELHSTNEELETMNEELQSMNEELETANGELRDRSLALDEANSFLESILGSLRSGFVVLNRDMAVRAWNRTAEDMWGLGADEVEGSHFLNLDIGLPVDQLRSPVSDVLAGGSDGEVVTLAAVNGRGRAIECTVNIAPLRDGNAVIGAILVMDA